LTLLSKARFAFLSVCSLTLASCTSVPVTDVPPAPVVHTVEHLASSDVDWLTWGIVACLAAALAAFLFRKYLPFNGTTSRVLLATALAFLCLRYALVIMTPFLKTIFITLSVCSACYLLLTRGPTLYAKLRTALHQWHAGSGT